ncbi:hypothetical protein ACJX0J_021356, partial [Zea mays]
SAIVTPTAIYNLAVQTKTIHVLMYYLVLITLEVEHGVRIFVVRLDFLCSREQLISITILKMTLDKYIIKYIYDKYNVIYSMVNSYIFLENTTLDPTSNYSNYSSLATSIYG